MKKRNLIIILSVAVLGVAALIITGQGAKKSTFEQNYHIEDISTITKIFMADKQNNSVLLTKGSDTNDTVWMIDNQYEANQSMVQLLLETLHDMRIRSQVNKSAVPNAIKNISANHVKCEVYQRKPLINWFGGALQLFWREKLTATYFVGHETQDNMGNYIFREGDDVPYIVHIPGFRGFISPRFVTDANLLRSHRIVNLNVKQIQSVALNITNSPEESFLIERAGDMFSLKIGNNPNYVTAFDTARVAQMLLSFSNLNFDEFAKNVPQAELDTTFSRKPVTILTITDTAGTSYKVATYQKYINPEDASKLGSKDLSEVFDLNRMYAILNEKDTVLIQYFSFDNILQPASYFMGREKQYFTE
ncbi:MAG: DUF4340 domain-containing protein [Bacteroidales bacterium]|nr:DUF4340 domain-containing protein [Bacteroidales bacterium]